MFQNYFSVKSEILLAIGSKAHVQAEKGAINNIKKNFTTAT